MIYVAFRVERSCTYVCREPGSEQSCGAIQNTADKKYIAVASNVSPKIPPEEISLRQQRREIKGNIPVKNIHKKLPILQHSGYACYERTQHAATTKQRTDQIPLQTSHWQDQRQTL